MSLKPTPKIKSAVLLVSHGSRSSKTSDEVRGITKALRSRLKGLVVQYAFLEIANPDIPQGIDACVKKGASRVIILLNFLNSGRHVDQDIPAIVRQAQQQYPHVTFTITSPIGHHPGIVDLFLGLIKKVPLT